MARTLFAPRSPATTSRTESRDGARRRLFAVPLIWRVVLVNTVVVLGGAVLTFWLTQQLVPRNTFTPFTHALLVLVALGLSSSVTMLVLVRSLHPIRSLRSVIQRFNDGDRSARADVELFGDPDVNALALEMNALWDRLESDAATIREKTAEAELLAAQVISAQEDERRRVARELHDEAGQALTALIIGLERGLASMPETYAPKLPVDPRKLVSDLRDLAAQTLDEVHKLAVELRPSVLDDLGLVAALRQYVRTSEERTGLRTRLSTTGFDEDADHRLPAPVETALFRIAQEAMTNVARHAQARSVEVRLRRSDGSVALDVRDDGVGFVSLAGLSPGEHFGMFGMRERARLLGGTFHVTNVSPRGTLVQVRIPLPDNTP